MSGGSFDYDSFKIAQFAVELKHKIDLNDDNELNFYGDKNGAGYGDETLARLKMCQQVIAFAGDLAHEVEWLYSGDHGEESFNKLIQTHMNAQIK